MVPNLSHCIRRLGDFRSLSTDSRLLIVQDLQTVLNGFKDVHAAIQFKLAFALQTGSEDLVCYLLDLITTTLEDGEYKIARGLGGALGAICRANINVKDMKQILKCLRGDAYDESSPEVTTKKGSKASCQSVLRALEVMARPVVETPLQSFFNFSGLGSGLFLPPIAWPFQSACQMLLWFRVEDFSSCKLNINDVSSPLCVPSISSFVTGDGIGIEYLLEDRSLCAKTVITRTKGTGMITTKTVLMRSTILEKNRCYSLVLQHSRPRHLYPTMSKDQIRLRVLLNREVAFDGLVPLSHQVNNALVNARIGKDFKGQISGVLLDAYNDEEAVAFERLESLKSCHSLFDLCSSLPITLNKATVGLEKRSRLRVITQSMEVWRRGRMKTLAIYAPCNCEGSIVREIISGWHATFGPNSCAWVSHHPRETICCLGGIRVLLPLLGPSSCNPLDQVVTYEHLRQRGRHQQHSSSPTTNGSIGNDDWLPLAQVILVLASFLSNNNKHQLDFMRLGGLELLEEAISSRPTYSFFNSMGTLDNGEVLHQAKCLALSVEYFCWSCAPVGSSAWKSSIVRLLGTMRIWSAAPSCFRTALLLSFEKVTNNAIHIPFQDGQTLTDNVTLTLNHTSVLEALALSCPPPTTAISSPKDGNNCRNVNEDELLTEREAVLRILIPMVFSTPQNGVELASWALLRSASTLANDSITFMSSLLLVLHTILQTESLREDVMNNLIATTTKVVQAHTNGEVLTAKEVQFVFLCYLLTCGWVQHNGGGAHNTGDVEQLKAAVINVVGGCIMTPSAFFERDKWFYLAHYLRRLLVPNPALSSPAPPPPPPTDNGNKLDSEIDVRGAACEALVSFTCVDSFVYESRHEVWLSLLMESMLHTSLPACVKALFILEKSICGGGNDERPSSEQQKNNHHLRFGRHFRGSDGSKTQHQQQQPKMSMTSPAMSSLYLSWLWQRPMVKIHVRLLMESSVKYEAALSSSVQIHAELLCTSIAHSSWSEEVELLLELVLQEDEACAKRAAILVLIKFAGAFNHRVSQNILGDHSSSGTSNDGSWFWDNVPSVVRVACILCEWCKKSVATDDLCIEECLSLSNSILEIFDARLLENQLLCVATTATAGSNHWTEPSTKEAKDALRRKMTVLGVSLLQLCMIILEKASIRDNPVWVLLNGKRIASVYRQVATLLSQRTTTGDQEIESQKPLCIAPFVLSTANSGLVQLSKQLVRMKESPPPSNESGIDQLFGIDAAVILSEGLKVATSDALEMLEKDVETGGVCDVSEALLRALRSALVESTTTPHDLRRSIENMQPDSQSISNWDTACQSLEWVRCSRYFEPEISEELKSHAQNIFSAIRVDQGDPCSSFRGGNSSTPGSSSSSSGTAVEKKSLFKQDSFRRVLLLKRCQMEDVTLVKESEFAIATVKINTAIMKDGLEQLRKTMRVAAQCDEDLNWQVTKTQWDGFIRNCMEEWSPWAPSGPISYRLSYGEGNKMLQMLLLPNNDCDTIDYKNVSYDGNEPESPPMTDSSKLNIPGVKPLSPVTPTNACKSLDILYGETREDTGVEGKNQDNSEVKNENSPMAGELVRGLGTEADGWEEITVGIAQAAERDVIMESQLAVKLGKEDGSIARQWQVLMVLPGKHIGGTLFLSKRTLGFRSSKVRSGINGRNPQKSYALGSSSYDYEYQQWCLCHLQRIFLRRYMLDIRAVELFWIKANVLWCRNVLLAFDSASDMKSFVNALKQLSYTGAFPLFVWPKSQHPASVLRASHLTEAWRRRQISNFDYLVCLNIFAGRSYNDMTQYPIMPWVLADYESPELDLLDSRSFRDLSKPVGALSEKRLNAFRERYESFLDPMIPRFLYGSHYSSPGIVLHYLVRQEPYTAMHVGLQGDRFDCPDRLFFDINQSWRNCLSSMSDVKELIPELFCCPEVFSNSRCLPLGTLQDGSGDVHNVRLPPWASDSPHKFVRQHRLALESEKVSSHLHEWIDLVFGYKQRGEAASRSDNVFYYLTYEGAVNVASITDSIQRKAVEAQVAHFGQTPSQLLKDPHPPRMPPEGCVTPCFSVPSRIQVFRPRHQIGGGGELGPILSICCNSRRVVVVHAKGLTVTSYSWTSLPDGEGLPFSLKLERSCPLACAPFFVHDTLCDDPFNASQETQNDSADDILPSPMASKFALVSSSMEGSSRMGMAATSPVPSGNVMDCLISCGYWDGCLKVHSLNTTGVGSSGLDCLSSSRGLHVGRITCLASGWDGGECVVTTGGDGTLVCVWRFSCERMCSVLVHDGHVGCEMCVGSCTSPSAMSNSSVTVRAQRLLPGMELENGLCCILSLYGHDAPIKCLAICGDVGLIASGAADGRIALHTLRSGSYIRTLWLPGGQHSYYHHPSPHLLCLTQHGDLIVHSKQDSSLHLLTVNGTHVASVPTPGVVQSILPTADGESIICSHSVKGEVASRSLLDLHVGHTLFSDSDHGNSTAFPPAHIMDMHLAPRDEFLLIGLESGEVKVATDVKTRLSMIHTAFKAMYL